MLRTTAVCVAIFAVLGGCQQVRYRSMNLGEVGYTAAYQTAVLTLRDYYPLESSDAGSGIITGRPRPVIGRVGTLVTTTTAREWPELRIRREKKDIWADIRIVIERQQSDTFAYFAAMDAQREAPDQTPAQEDAPFTREQKEVWSVEGNNWQLEREILNDLYLRLHPE